MTAPENRVSRWARLKRESASERKSEPEAEGPRPEPVASPDTGPGLAQHEGDQSADEPFDPSSLPSIEAITVDTDIRAFLEGRVPAKLTQAALRRAWAVDPAIRDFVGIAENQWDFNDPNAIPGFGSLQGATEVEALLEQALGRCDKLAEALREVPLSIEQVTAVATDHEPADLDQAAQQAPYARAVDADICRSPEEGVAIRSDHVAQGEDPLPKPRFHGSALPR